MVAVLMIAGFVSSGVSGYLITRGGNKTKKTEVVEKMLREELEIEARKRIHKEEIRQQRIELEQQGLLPPKAHHSWRELTHSGSKHAVIAPVQEKAT